MGLNESMWNEVFYTKHIQKNFDSGKSVGGEEATNLNYNYDVLKTSSITVFFKTVQSSR